MVGGWIRAEGGCEGEDYLNTFKGGGTEKRGRETKILRGGGGGKLDQGVVGALKRGGWNPFTNYNKLTTSAESAETNYHKIVNV